MSAPLKRSPNGSTPPATAVPRLLVSSDLTEILALSDRVSVIYRGEIVGVLDRADAHHDRLGELMAGLTASTEVTA